VGGSNSYRPFSRQFAIDFDAELVERWRTGDERPEILTDRLEWQPSAEHASLSIDLDAFFRDVRGE
jgi:hypothetical protein